MCQMKLSILPSIPTTKCLEFQHEINLTYDELTHRSKNGKVGHFTSESIDKIIEVSTLGILLCQIGFALISKGPFNKFIFLS